jgi:hypothetical protein
MANPVFFAGAETGDLSEIVSITGTVTVSSTIVHSPGVYSYLVNGSSGPSSCILVNGLLETTSYFRCWALFNAIPSPAAVGVLQVYDTGQNLIGKVILSTTGILDAQATGDTAVAGTHVLAVNTWYLIEAQYVQGTGANAQIQVRLGGVVEATSSNGTATTVVYSWAAVANQNMSMYVDDVTVRSDQYAGDGRVLARQGITGSPQYNGWTETGGSISVVWSKTPWASNDTTYAAATAASQIQSMLIASFANPGIGPIDTINSVKVSAIGKFQIAGTVSQRLIFYANATLQNSGLLSGLTASDQYFEYYPPTIPTNAQLNACQGGAMQGSNAADFFQIEALWVQADFTPVWFDERGTDVPLFELQGVTSYG